MEQEIKGVEAAVTTVLCRAEPVGGANRPRDATPAITRVVIILGAGGQVL
jgi:hypothetical protein